MDSSHEQGVTATVEGAGDSATAQEAAGRSPEQELGIPADSEGSDVYPSSISALCSFLGLSYTNIFLPCNYCQNTLSSVECVLFDFAECNILWKNGCAYAICYYCIKILARFEFAVFFKNSCTASRAEELLGKPLTEFKIRCVACLRRMQKVEVEGLRQSDSTIYVVAHKLRAQCFLCGMGMF